jgi:hypothetical protein
MPAKRSTSTFWNRTVPAISTVAQIATAVSALYLNRIEVELIVG